MRLKKGDIVGRISYGKDIAFVIANLIQNGNSQIAILKGLVLRIEADSPIEDLELIENDKIFKQLSDLNKRLEVNPNSLMIDGKLNKRARKNYGRILHLDGDRKYSEKSLRFYKNMGLNVVVKNIPENRQPQQIEYLLSKYDPDILVVTGHDGMIKGHNFNDIYNYRNSKYFVETVIRARRWERERNNIAIFAGACQSYYEALIDAGANFASSPARILIDFKDPLVVAEQLAKTESNKYVTIDQIRLKLRDGERGVNGIGTYGKMEWLSWNLLPIMIVCYS